MEMKDHQVDFATVLGAAVHDMKNSLSLLIQSIENIGNSINKLDFESTENLASAHYEAARLNTGLVQLLSLYRAGLGNLPINIDQHYIDDVVEEILARNESYLAHKKIALEVRQQAELVWYLDSDLINILLNDVLINSMRYSEQKILMTVFEENGYLIFQVEDDGPGYPKSMLDANEINIQDYDISQGRTGLGLFFARLIARGHSNDQRQGSITLANGGVLGGSLFTLKLP
jgi:K+-sensing histidine kinase KdpD